MLYEAAWTRALALVIRSSTYAFAAVLVAFLLGISRGAAAYAVLWGRRRASRVRADPGRSRRGGGARVAGLRPDPSPPPARARAIGLAGPRPARPARRE